MAAEQGIFVFGNSTLVFPRETEDECLNGIPINIVHRDLGDIDYNLVPVFDGPPPVKGILLDENKPLPPEWKEVSLRDLITVTHEKYGNSPIRDRLFRVYQILLWRRESLYCGSCGHRNEDHHGELTRLCPSCGRIEFPRISPGISVLIKNDKDQILLAHNKNFRDGVFSPPAGFVEAGEKVETAIKREVREELGIEIDNLEYITSQPWPFPNSLVLAFKARYVSGTIKEDGNEILEARWFDRSSLEKEQMPRFGTIGYYCMEKWLEGKL